MRRRSSLLATALALLLAACGAPVAHHQAPSPIQSSSTASGSVASAVGAVPASLAAPDGLATAPSPQAATSTVAATSRRLPVASPRSFARITTLQPFAQLHMLDATTGWAIGGGWDIGLPWALYRTSDGGAHWTDVSPPGFPFAHQGAQFLDATTAVAAIRRTDGGVVILHTANGGGTWTATPDLRIAVNGSVPSLPIGLTFLDAQHGWLSTSGGGMFSNLQALFQTSDGGQQWNEVATKLPISALLGFSSPTTGWATDSHAGSAFATLDASGPTAGALYVTHDAGRTWRYQPLPLLPGEASDQPVNLLGPPRFATVSDGILPELVYAGGQITETSLEVYQTHDAGQTWTTTRLLPLGTTRTAGIADFLNAHDGWAIAGQALATTQDGGAQWTTFTPTGSTLDVNSDGLRTLDFVSASTGWALETPPRDPAAWSLRQTRDGGHTWRRLQPVAALPQAGAGGQATTTQSGSGTLPPSDELPAGSSTDAAQPQAQALTRPSCRSSPP